MWSVGDSEVGGLWGLSGLQLAGMVGREEQAEHEYKVLDRGQLSEVVIEVVSGHSIAFRSVSVSVKERGSSCLLMCFLNAGGKNVGE